MAASLLSGQSSVSYADAIIAQVPAGCGWTFSIVLLNLSRRDISVKVNFWQSGGRAAAGAAAQPRLLPIRGIGEVGAVNGVIPADGSYTISLDESAGQIGDCNGWAEVNSEEPVGGYVVLNQRSTAGFSIDTTVPVSSRFASRFMVPFDTTNNRDTAFALVNPSFQTDAGVMVTYRNESGRVICDEVRQLRRGEQQAYSLRQPADLPGPAKCGSPRYSQIVGIDGNGIRGVAEFSTTSLELSGFALGFGGLGFVSYPAQSPVGR